MPQRLAQQDGLTVNGLVAYNGGSWYLFKRKYKIKS
jgi:hypothetical protein